MITGRNWWVLPLSKAFNTHTGHKPFTLLNRYIIRGTGELTRTLILKMPMFSQKHIFWSTLTLNNWGRAPFSDLSYRLTLICHEQKMFMTNSTTRKGVGDLLLQQKFTNFSYSFRCVHLINSTGCQVWYRARATLSEYQLLIWWGRGMHSYGSQTTLFNSCILLLRLLAINLII